MAYTKIIASCVCILLLAAASIATAQDQGSVQGWSPDVLEIYLDRADRAEGRSDWLGIAERGTEAAIADWEQDALLLFETGAAFEEARQALGEIIEDTVQERYSQWLVKRFFERLPTLMLDPVFDTVRQENLTYLYQIENGRILREEETQDPILQGLEGFEEDRQAWHQGVESSIADVLADWGQSVEAAAPELLAEIPDDRRAAMSGLVEDYTSAWRDAYQRELDALFMQEEARFVALRSFDQFSLRRKSEAETAGEIANNLIEETRRSLDEDLRTLRQGLKETPQSQGSPIQIEAEKWLESFKQAFEAGLAKWAQAEESMLVERVEWERRAGEDFAAGQQAWADAYKQLREKRTAWETEIRVIRDEGLAQWQAEEEDLRQKLVDFSAELDRDISDRTDAMGQRLESLIGMFSQSTSMMASAKSSAEYWLDKLQIRNLDLNASAAALENAANASAITENKAAAIDQLMFWKGVWDTYGEYRTASRQELLSTYSSILADYGETAALKSILMEDGTDPESVLLDEYQVELLKAGAIAEYWNRQYEIALAVNQYAIDVSSNRPTEQETRARYEAALVVYELARDEYEDALDALEAAGSALSDRTTAIRDAQAELVRCMGALEEADSAYQTALAIFDVGDTTFFAEQIQGYYKSLLESLYPDEDTPESENLAVTMAEYRSAARRYGFEEEIQEASNQLAFLVNGLDSPYAENPGAGLPSLDELRDAVDEIVIPGGGAMPADAGGFGMDSTNPYYALLSEYFTRYAGAVEGSQEKAFLAEHCKAIARRARADASIALQERLCGIMLLSTGDIGAWYTTATGSAGDPPVWTGMAGALEDRVQEAAGAFLLARARLERDALVRWSAVRDNPQAIAGLNAALPADFLALRLCLDSTSAPADAGSCIQSLNSLIAYLDGGRLNLADNLEGLRGLALDSAYLSAFISGAGSFISEEGIDLTTLALSDQAAARESAARLLSVFTNYSSLAPGLAAAREAEGRTMLSAALEEAGLLSNALTMELRDPSAVGRELEGMGAEEREQWLADAAEAVFTAGGLLPAYQGEQLNGWFQKLTEYVALLAVESGAGADGSAAEAQAEIDSLSRRLNRISEILQGMETGGGGLSMLCRISDLMREPGMAGGVTIASLDERLIAAGAIRTAENVMGAGGEPTDADWEAAFSQSFPDASAPTLALRSAIIERARTILAIQRTLTEGAGARTLTGEERTAYAYGLWLENDIEDAISDLVVSPFAEELRALRALVEADAAADVIDGYIAACTPEAQAALNEVRALLSGTPESADDIFLSALCGGDPAGLAASWSAEISRGGEAYQRAMSLKIASQLSGPNRGAVLSLIQELSGIQSFGGIPGAAFGDLSYDIRREALLGLAGTDISVDARLFYIKTLALQGEDVQGLLAGLGTDAGEEAERFLSILDAARGWLPGLGQSETQYADSVLSAEDAGDIAVYAAAVVNGAWADPIFTSDLTHRLESSGYLSMLSALESGVVGRFLSLASGRLAESAAGLESRRLRSTFVKSYRDVVEAEIAGNYRTYLTEELLNAGDSMPKPTSEAAADYTASDEAGESNEDIAHMETANALQNALLEGYNRLLSAGRNLTASLSAGDQERAGEQAVLQGFAEGIVELLAEDNMEAAWDTHAFFMDSETRVAMSNAAEALADLMNRMELYKSEIVRLGEAIAEYQDSDAAETLAELGDALEEAREDNDAAQAAMNAANNGFAAAIGAYNAAYAAAKAEYEDLEESRFNLITQQEIYQYASSGYLQSGAAMPVSLTEEQAEELYETPAERLAYMTDRRDRARTVLEVLDGLYDGQATERPATDAEYLTAREEYAESYRRYLAFKKLQAELFAEIAAQEERIYKLQREYDLGISGLIDATGVVFTQKDAQTEEYLYDWAEVRDHADSTPEEGTRDSEWNARVPALFVNLVDGQGIRLSYNGSFDLSRNSAEDWAALREYFEGEYSEGSEAGSCFETDLRLWVGDLGDYLTRTNFTAVLGRWGLAAGYLKQQLYNNIDEDDANEYEKVMKAALGEDAPGSEDGCNGGLEKNLSDYTTDTGIINELGGWEAYIENAGRNALAAMSGRERRLFEFYLAMDVLGEADDTPRSLDGDASDLVYGTFKDASRLEIYQWLSNRLSDFEDEHMDSAKGYIIAANAAIALSIVLAPIPFVGTALSLAAIWEAAGFMALGFAERVIAEGYKTVNKTIEAEPLGTLREDVQSSKTAIHAVIEGSSATLAELGSAEARLAAILGETPGGEKPSREAFLASLREMYTARGGVLDPEMEAYINGYYGGASGSDTREVLTAMIDQSEADWLTAETVMDRRISTLEQNRQSDIAEYQAALASFINGDAGTTEAELAGLAAAALLNPAYTPSDHGKAMFDVQDALGLEPGFTDLVQYESARNDVLGDMQGNLLGLYTQRLEALREIRVTEWSLRQQELQQEMGRWQSSMNAIITRGMQEWDASAGKLAAAQKEWQKSFEEEYTAKSDAWNKVFTAFQNAKLEWVEKSAAKASEVGNNEILAELGDSAMSESRSASGAIITDIGYAFPDAGGMLAELMDGMTVSQALAAGKVVNLGIGTVVGELARGVKLEGGAVSAMALVQAFQNREDEEITLAATMIVADQARESLAEAREASIDSVEEANAGFKQSMDRMFVLAGYSDVGGNYEREGIIGSTVMSGVVTEHQAVEGYEEFAVPSFAIGTDLSAMGLEGLSAVGVQARLTVAMRELKLAREKVFGREGEARHVKEFRVKDYTTEEEGDDIWTDLGEALAETFAGVKQYKEATITKSYGPGEFGAWIGYAPDFVAVPDTKKSMEENILLAGKGQLGRLIAWYGYYQIKAGKGFQELAMPVWDKPLFNATNLPFEAPSLRTVADIGVSVAALCTGNVWLAAAINLADDAAFGLMDVAGGYKDIGDVALDFGKKAVVGFGTAAIGGVFGLNDAFGKGFGVDAWLGDFGESVVGKTLMTGAQGFTSSAFAGAANSITYEDGQLGWNGTTFTNSVFGKNAIGGYLASMTTTLTAGTLDLGLEGFVNGTLFNGRTLDAFIGGLAGQAVNYAISGEASFNLLNASMFGLTDANGQAVSMGLLELKLSGEDGASMALGSGGMDASLGTIVNSIMGLESWGVNAGLLFSDQEEALKYASSMRTLYSTGSGADKARYESVLAGATNIVEDPTGDFGAQTVTDQATGITTVTLGKGALSDMGRFAKNIYLSHESYRNGTDDGAQGQTLETAQSIIGHIRTAQMLAAGYGAESIGKTMLDEVNALQKAFEGDVGALMQVMAGYDSSEDFWKMAKDGRLFNDGSGWLQNADGKYVNTDGSLSDAPILGKTIGAKGIETGLLNILYGGTSNKTKFDNDKTKTVQDLLIASGFVHNPATDTKDWYWGGDGRAATVSEGVLWWQHEIEVALNAPVSEGGNMGRYLNSLMVSNLFGGTIAETVFRGMNQGTIDALSHGNWIIFGGPSPRDHASWQRMYSLAEQQKNIIDNIPIPGNPAYSIDIRENVNDLMTGVNFGSYLNGHSCDLTSDELAREMKWKNYFTLTSQGGIFGSPDEKIDWLKKNPQIGLFLGAYYFSNNDGTMTLNQLVKSGIPNIDGDYWNAIKAVDELVTKGHIALGITPRYENIQDIYSQFYTSPHIGIFVLGTNDQRKSGGWVTGGGYTSDDWSGWSIGKSTKGYFYAGGTYGWKREQRPFYLYALYQ